MECGHKRSQEANMPRMSGVTPGRERLSFADTFVSSMAGHVSFPLKGGAWRVGQGGGRRVSSPVAGGGSVAPDAPACHGEAV